MRPTNPQPEPLRGDSGEFALIRRHFSRPGVAMPSNVVLGVGDDGALLQPAPGQQLVVSSDMLVEGRHFFAGTDPQTLGHKALAVNLSDLAAMGARPLGFTLALALPAVDDGWLTALASGLFSLADAHACPLVGGDTTRGPLNLCITVFGEVAPGQALRRDAARVGDDLWLSGRTGEARLALDILLGHGWAADSVKPQDLVALRQRLECPTPRVALGQALAGLAHAAIDISDGLAGDLGHILQASGVGADIDGVLLPLAPALTALPPERQLACLLNGGDDYELLFTAPLAARARIQAAASACHTPVQRIGQITESSGLHLLDSQGRRHPIEAKGFDHFDIHGA